MPFNQPANLVALATRVDRAYGAEAAELGAQLRDEGEAANLARLLMLEDVPAVAHHAALMILSNLVSDAFEPQAAQTRRLVLDAGIFARLVNFVFAEHDTVATTYACACLQNLCREPACARLLRVHEALEQLEQLAQWSDSEAVKSYAAGALFNAVEAMRIEAAGHAAQLRGGHAHHRSPSPPSPSRPSSERREAPRGPAARNDIQSRYQARGAGGGGMRGSLLGRFLPLDVDEELDLPAEVLERVANREAEWLSHAYTEAHASVLIEAAARGWHGRRKAARQRAHAAAALRIQFAGRLRGKVLERRRRRAELRAARTLQAHARAAALLRRARAPVFGSRAARGANVANATVAAAVGALLELHRTVAIKHLARECNAAIAAARKRERARAGAAAAGARTAPKPEALNLLRARMQRVKAIVSLRSPFKREGSGGFGTGASSRRSPLSTGSNESGGSGRSGSVGARRSSTAARILAIAKGSSSGGSIGGGSPEAPPAPPSPAGEADLISTEPSYTVRRSSAAI